ncbi:MAG: non-heme iron oxygenase ferredoxin subunit [Pseudomonas sp.]|nr:non-heme iron oxygenase ferredoxin subunit [Pseudomonas sp.]
MKTEVLTFQKVATVDEVDDGDVKKVRLDGLILALFNLGGEFFALHHLCTHEDVSLIDGFVVGGEIECPLHAGRFDIRTGKAMSAPCTVDARTYPVEVRGNDVFVGVPSHDACAV